MKKPNETTTIDNPVKTSYIQPPVETLQLFLTAIKCHINTYDTITASLKQETLPMLSQVLDHYELKRKQGPCYNPQKLDQTIALLKHEIIYRKQTKYFRKLCQDVLSLTLENLGKTYKDKGKIFDDHYDSNQPTLAAELLQASATLNGRSIEAEAFQIMAGPTLFPA